MSKFYEVSSAQNASKRRYDDPHSYERNFFQDFSGVIKYSVIFYLSPVAFAADIKQRHFPMVHCQLQNIFRNFSQAIFSDDKCVIVLVERFVSL